MTDQLARILPGVQKPARYVGGEYNEIIKDKQSVTTRVAFCFPDTYEIGMSNLGMRILIRHHERDARCLVRARLRPLGRHGGRDALRAHQLPLFALESGDPLAEFDIIGFSIGYEMSLYQYAQYAGAGRAIPLRSADRPGLHTSSSSPGAPAPITRSPWPTLSTSSAWARGRTLTRELIALLNRPGRSEGWAKQQYLRPRPPELEGVYVPSFYTHDLSVGDGALTAITPAGRRPGNGPQAHCPGSGQAAYYPAKTIVPSTEIVHDRVRCWRCSGAASGAAGSVRRATSTARSGPAAPRRCCARQEAMLLGLRLPGDDPLLPAPPATIRQLERLCDGLLEFCEHHGRSTSPCPPCGRTTSPWISDAAATAGPQERA